MKAEHDSSCFMFACHEDVLKYLRTRYFVPPEPRKEEHMQTPSIGRVVHYTGPGNNIPEGQPGHFPPTPYPSDIVKVGPDNRCTLFVKTLVGFMILHDIPFSETPAPGHWNWPPRV